jgi:hypothetical protein
MRIGRLSQAVLGLFQANSLCSLQFNIVSKGLGSERMSFYLNEAAGDIRDLLLPTLEAPKPKL